MSNFYIKTVADAKKCIGERIYWDDVSSRHVFLRSGILERAIGYNLVIDGDYKYRPDMPGLRNFENGGAWEKSRPPEKTNTESSN